MTDDTEQILNERDSLRYMLNAVRMFLHGRRESEYLADLLRAVDQAERTLKLPRDIWLKGEK